MGRHRTQTYTIIPGSNENHKHTKYQGVSIDRLPPLRLISVSKIPVHSIDLLIHSFIHENLSCILLRVDYTDTIFFLFLQVVHVSFKYGRVCVCVCVCVLMLMLMLMLMLQKEKKYDDQLPNSQRNEILSFV